MKIDKSEIALRLGKLKSILTNKLDETANGVLFKDNCLFANNYEIGIKARLDIDTAETFVIPRRAIEMIENLPQGIIEITGDEKSISIKSGSIKNKYSTTAPEEFPLIDTFEEAIGSATLNGGKFQDALNSVLYAVSENSNKPILTGVLLDAKEGSINIVGCDGYRISWNKLSYDDEFNVVIPKNTIQKLLSIGIAGDISFSWNDKKIIFRNKDYEVCSRILDGSYIDYNKLFVRHENQTIIDRKNFSEAIHRAMICINDRDVKGNALVFHFDEDDVKIAVKQENSEYEESIKLDAPVDQPVGIAFNGRYVFEAIKSFTADKLSVHLGTPLQPMLLDDGDLMALVLPVKL